MSNNIRALEQKYLKAKISYYEGNPFLSDDEFDALEELLKKEGSRVIEQVGSKRKDFDFNHPNKMLSLAKVQTHKNSDGGIDYNSSEFLRWYNKNASKINKKTNLVVSPKFDGSAINIIYEGTKLSAILTRGDGKLGKDITNKISPYIPKEIEAYSLRIGPNDILEVRCEVVINVHLFNKKYSKEFANPRNYVAGVIGQDEINHEKLSEFTIVPLNFILNGVHKCYSHFKHLFKDINEILNKQKKLFTSKNITKEYQEVIDYFIKGRESISYQLDGLVISFPVEYRTQLGENDHDPNWALAVKFPPKETVTTVEGFEWSVSKRGEITPVLLLKPVLLDGTTVKRASGYNAGYLLEKGVGPGATVSLSKAGDIIPEVQKVIIASPEDVEDFIPDICPVCGTITVFEMPHLCCTNKNCEGRITKQLTSALHTLDIQRVGAKTIAPFAKRFKNMYEVIMWVFIYGDRKEIEEFGIKYGSRSHQIFLEAFTNVKSLDYMQVIQILGYDNVGRKLSKQIALEHAGLPYDYAHLEKALVAQLRSPEATEQIKEAVSGLESLGIVIHKPKQEVHETIGVCMTGSPKTFGYKTKAEFISNFANVVEVSLSDPSCKYLITDSYESTSGKMKTAKKKGIEIRTYKDFRI